jgi:hypothetical protein
MVMTKHDPSDAIASAALHGVIMIVHQSITTGRSPDRARPDPRRYASGDDIGHGPPALSHHALRAKMADADPCGSEDRRGCRV